MSYSTPTIDDFKTYFSRDFPFGADPNENVTDADIVKAMQQANVFISQALFGSQASFNIGYELLSAHYLVLNLRASSQGINGQFGFLEASKSVGSVSQSFQIPQRYLDNPVWAGLTQTTYGYQYLQMILPQLTGVMYSVQGRTHA